MGSQVSIDYKQWVRGTLVCGRMTVVGKNNTRLAKKVQLQLLVILKGRPMQRSTPAAQ